MDNKDFVKAFYHGKPIYSGSLLVYPEKASLFASLLRRYGWCFPPIPVVNMGEYYQSVNGTHRLEACRQIDFCPEIIVMDIRLNPLQPIPDNWWKIVEAPLPFGRTIWGYETTRTFQRNHIGVVIDESREVLRKEYVQCMFSFLYQLQLMGSNLITEEGRAVDPKVEEYLAKKIRFSENGELYQSLPDNSIKATRNMCNRWKLYGISDEFLTDKTILDIGCNIGGLSAFCEEVCKSYKGIDIEPESIALAQHLYSFPKCSFEVKSVLDEKGVYDIIFSLSVWYYLGISLDEYAKKMASFLNPGGTLFHENHGNEELHPEAFEPYFEIIRHLQVPHRTGITTKGPRIFAEMRKK